MLALLLHKLEKFFLKSSKLLRGEKVLHVQTFTKQATTPQFVLMFLPTPCGGLSYMPNSFSLIYPHTLPWDFTVPLIKEVNRISPHREAGFVPNRMR